MGNKFLGINFGVDALDIVEVEKSNIIRNYRVAYETEGQESNIVEVTDEIKLTALLQKTIRTNNIETRDVIAALPSEDVLLRSFLIPQVSKTEMQSAIEFESRKFIPFKLEEIYFDFATQKLKDPKAARLKCSFAGMKKTILDKFQYILEQSNLRILYLEPVSFSLLRLFLFKKVIKPDETIAIVEVSAERGSICIIERGFPQLIRDFKFRHLGSDPRGADMVSLISRLKNEIHVSFDYYSRQFSDSSVNKIFFHSKEDTSEMLGNLKNEIDTPIELITNTLEITDDFDLGSFKAYGSTLRQSFRSQSDINLYRKRDVLEEKPRDFSEDEPIDYQIVIRVGIFAVAFIVLILLSNFVRGFSVSSKLKKIESLKSQLDPKYAMANIKQLERLKTEFEKKLKVFEELHFDRSITPILNSLVHLMPDGVWISELNYGESTGALAFEINGYAYLEDEPEQLNAINNFLSLVKNNTEFKTKFKSIVLSNISQAAIEQWRVSKFLIKCK